MPAPIAVTFIAGRTGPWSVERIEAIAGAGLDMAERLAVLGEGPNPRAAGEVWRLSGTSSHLRYTRRAEADILAARQTGPGRPEDRRAALIPIRKSDAWWSLAQDERRAIFEEQSRHIRLGLDYLPAIARRLVHCRDQGGPFDFLTWFEFAAGHAADFDALLARLRATAEWTYVEREVDIRLVRTDAVASG